MGKPDTAASAATTATGGQGSECVIGWDIGTTGARAVVFDLQGRQRQVAAAEYPLHTPRPGWAEQDPEQVYQAAMACLRQATAWASGEGLHALGLGVSAILHSLVPLRRDGSALGPSIIWADGRSVDQAAAIRTATDPLALYQRTGCPVHPMYLPPKLRWLQRHQEGTFRDAATFGGIKEYVLRRWTGLSVCDRSIASGTGLFNLQAGTWDDEALQLAGIDAGRLPPLVEPTQPLEVPQAALRDVGLPPDCVVVAGGGDGVLQTIGTGCVAPGQLVAMVATSGAMRAVVEQPRTDRQARTWCYYLADGRWVAGAAINNAGLVYAWLRDQLQGAAGTELELETLNEWAASVPAGSHGLLFLPYLAGERSPNWNANARGLLFGLSLAHDYRHLARATLEGVAYRMRTIFEPMEEVAGPATEIRATGGFVRSPLWLQIVADVLGRPLTLTESPEASSLGAAQLALRGAGVARRFEDLAPIVDTGAEVTPHEASHQIYRRLYAIYQRVYDHVRDQFDALAALQAELSTSPSP
ncbi:MAG TPA: gluconokinase [Chloroflexota bacterium]|jgi:gluconokinase|nr:gluconokinase [Chloroflexota bacterium]